MRTWSPSEAALWRVTERVVRRYGLDAGTVAAMKADDLLGRIELERAHLWLIIQRRADILLARGTARVQ